MLGHGDPSSGDCIIIHAHAQNQRHIQHSEMPVCMAKHLKTSDAIREEVGCGAVRYERGRGFDLDLGNIGEQDSYWKTR